ncbi:MSC_0623 family F1-like ATPase-associated protein [Metamycoplasma hyosynoviae]|uniref:MSC_0623 family F1-like ATPase-associated protein n=1 Tax=Metamycoplasma hyosynoviae TaxID=29559 RepID=UPI0023625842|nr:DUF2714 domain-containing protein [Metamycoplasma hyosynoviae]MDD1359209.1 DUF2714 domain-containing protein [Metamycoplasma hyosynoviae]
MKKNNKIVIKDKKSRIERKIEQKQIALGLTNFVSLFKIYNEILDYPNFISFEKLVNTILVNNTISQKSEAFVAFTNIYTDAFANQKDIQFTNFVVSYNVDNKYGANKLVPIISAFSGSDVYVASLTTSLENEELNLFLGKYNELISTLLLEGKYVEILPSLIAYQDSIMDPINLFFDKTHVKIIK